MPNRRLTNKIKKYSHQLLTKVHKDVFGSLMSFRRIEFLFLFCFLFACFVLFCFVVCFVLFVCLCVFVLFCFCFFAFCDFCLFVFVLLLLYFACLFVFLFQCEKVGPIFFILATICLAPMTPFNG